MEDTYTIMRVFAGSWGMMFLLLSFLGVILFTLRPGSRRSTATPRTSRSVMTTAGRRR
jgi:cbb3-type cytochrome oxidase subunit 3